MQIVPGMLIAVLVFALALFIAIQQSMNNISTDILVPTEKWPVNSQSIQAAATQIAAEGKPVIFRGAPSDEWQSRKQWSSLEGFVKSMGAQTEMDNVFHIANESVLFFNPAMPMANSRRTPWQPPFSHASMSVAQFSQHLSSTKDRESETEIELGSYYFSGDVKHDVCLSRVAEMVTRKLIEPFVVPNGENRNIDDAQVHLWLGGPNITSRAHYDTYHNFYIQHSGSKEFLLYPPSEWKHLHLFPSLHPSNRQSQFDIRTHTENESRGEERHRPVLPELANDNVFRFTKDLARPVVAKLRAGDVLYLPPHWFHQVRSLDISLSVNVWTESHDGKIGKSIVSEALPFVQDQRWSDSQLDKAAFMLLTQVVNAGVSGVAHSLVFNIVDSQFVPLLRNEPVKLKPVFKMNGMSCDQLADRLTDIPDELLKQVEAQGRVVEKQLESLSSDAVRQLNFANFAQGIGSWSVGPDLTMEYLECVWHATTSTVGNESFEP